MGNPGLLLFVFSLVNSKNVHYKIADGWSQAWVLCVGSYRSTNCVATTAPESDFSFSLVKLEVISCIVLIFIFMADFCCGFDRLLVGVVFCLCGYLFVSLVVFIIISSAKTNLETKLLVIKQPSESR